MSCQSVVRAFLDARGLRRPTGRPIYSYRVTPEEAGAFRDALRNGLVITEYTPPDLHEAAAFLLFAADWWRRNYDASQGAYAWQPILDAIGQRPGIPLPLIHRYVSKGLMFWLQPLVMIGSAGDQQKKGWLASVACQGGIPTRVLSKEGTRIREFLRGVLSDRMRFDPEAVSTRQLALGARTLLPQSLQNDVFLELGAGAADAVAALLKHRPDPADPVSDLDRRLPDWRQTLPMDLDNEASRELLNILVRDAAEGHRRSRRSGIAVHTVLRPGGEAWTLERHVSVPGIAPGTSFTVFMGGARSGLPQRFELYRLLRGGGKALLAMATRFGKSAEDPLVALERTGPEEIVIGGAGGLEPVEVEIVSSRHTIGRGTADGGGELSALPWVFGRRGGESGDLELLGQGSVRTRDTGVHVAVPSGWGCLPVEGGKADRLGALLETDREVFSVEGTVRLHGREGDCCVVSTGVQKDDFVEYFTAPPRWVDAGGQPLYEALPVVHRAGPDATSLGDVPVGELEWRPCGRAQSWRRDTQRALGQCEVRVTTEGELRFQKEFRILPRGFRPTAEPHEDGKSGRLVLHGLEQAVHVQPHPDPAAEIKATRDEGLWAIACTALAEPPSTLRLRADLGEGRWLDIRLPFPVRTARFIGRDGNTLKDGAMVSLERIGGVRAEVLAPGQAGQFVVQIALRCPNGEDYLIDSLLDTDERLQELHPGVYGLDLSVLREQLSLMLATTTGLDAYFLLWIEATWGGQVKRRTLRISRYDLEFSLDRENERVGLAHASETRSTGLMLVGGAFRIQAFSLTQPAAIDEALPPTEDGGWRFGRRGRTPGPWLLAGMEGNYCRVRPTLWFISGEEGDGTAVGGGIPDHERVALLRDARQRREEYRRLMTELALRPDDQAAWQHLLSTLEAFWHLPPAAHDLFVGLSQAPAALAAVAVALPVERIAMAWDYFEQLPIQWHLVPVNAWRDAAVRRFGLLQALLKETAGFDEGAIVEELDRTLSESFSRLRQRLPSMALIEEVTREAMAGMVPGLPPPRERVLAKPPEFCNAVLEHWRATVLGRIGSERIPGWRGIEELASQISQSMGAPAATWVTKGVPEYALSLINSPACAAWSAAGGHPVSAEGTYRLRVLRSFEPGGFDQAYAAHLCMAVRFLRSKRAEVRE